MLLEVVDLVVVHGRLDRDRRERVDAVLVDLAGEALRRHVEHGREALDHPVAPLLLGHVADPELDRRSRHVPDDHLALAIEDRPTRRLDPDRSQLVVLGRVEIARPREHLERPEPEEEQREHGDRDDPEHADPDREPRREPVGGADARIGRKEAGRGVAPLAVRRVRQGARPPAPARPARSSRRACERARTPGRRAARSRSRPQGTARSTDRMSTAPPSSESST